MNFHRFRSAQTFNDVFLDDAYNKDELSFDYLMELHDETFVDVAYRLLLGRKADPTGIRYYTGRLRGGYSRISALHQLIRSPEARTDWRSIAGLAEEIDRYRRSRTLGGWRLALNDPELGRTPARRQARIFQNGMGAQRQLLLHASKQIHTEVAGSLGLAQTQTQRDEYWEAGRIGDGGGHRFQPPRPRAISEMRKADLPDRIRAAVRLLEF